MSEGIISEDDADQSLIIAAVWVNPDARDADQVYANNRAATREALRAGVESMPRVAEVLVARHRPFNPFYSPPRGGQEPAGTGADEGGQEPTAGRAEEEGYEPTGTRADGGGPEPAGSSADEEGRKPAGSGAGDGGQAGAPEPR